MSLWQAIGYLAWALSAVLAGWMLYDWLKTDAAYSEETLTSSREGEIEAVSEKHEIKEQGPE